MKVTITTDGMYSDFHGQFAGATERKKGDVVEYPDWYAGMLIGNCLAVVPVEAKSEPVAEVKPEAVIEPPFEPEVVPASRRPYTRKARKPSAK